jgi:glycosyltransferase involved in cell wall biosynthesis
MITVGFALSVDPNWLGGINYYKNLLTAIYEDPNRNIEVVLFTGLRANDAHFTGFPKLKTVRSSIFDCDSIGNRFRRLIKKVIRRDLVLGWLLAKHDIKVLSHSDILGDSISVPVISWIPDFQHLHLPALFSPEEFAERNRWFDVLTKNSKLVLLSSKNARDDLVRMIPEASDNSEVLHFVPKVNLQDETVHINQLEKKYKFLGPYLFLPNQYWAHKNHSVVIEALAILQRSGRHVRVISTGSHLDPRNPDLYNELCERIKVLGLERVFLILGIVPYVDLQALMRYSVAVINPSLFEGWSSTVEEAKAFGKRVILSDIPVHREQAPRGALYFDAHDPIVLAEAIWDLWEKRSEDFSDNSISLVAAHEERRRSFSQRYHEIVYRAAGVAKS